MSHYETNSSKSLNEANKRHLSPNTSTYIKIRGTICVQRTPSAQGTCTSFQDQMTAVSHQRSIHSIMQEQHRPAPGPRRRPASCSWCGSEGSPACRWSQGCRCPPPCRNALKEQEKPVNARPASLYCRTMAHPVTNTKNHGSSSHQHQEPWLIPSPTPRTMAHPVTNTENHGSSSHQQRGELCAVWKVISAVRDPLMHRIPVTEPTTGGWTTSKPYRSVVHQRFSESSRDRTHTSGHQMCADWTPLAVESSS